MNIDVNPCNRYVNQVNKSVLNADSVIDNSNVKNTKSVEKEKVDVVTISPNASCLMEIKQKVGNITSEVENTASQEKLDSLKQKIHDGSYSVSAEDVAKSILDRLSD